MTDIQTRHSNGSALRSMIRTSEEWSKRLSVMEYMTDMAPVIDAFAKQIKHRLKLFSAKKIAMLDDKPKPVPTMDEILDSSFIYEPQLRENITILLSSICADFRMTYEEYRNAKRSKELLDAKRILAMILHEMGLRNKQICVLAHCSPAYAYAATDEKNSSYDKFKKI